MAYEKPEKYPEIIPLEPPKSGKTFNADILALHFSVFKYFQPILIGNPEEIEIAHESERK